MTRVLVVFVAVLLVGTVNVQSQVQDMPTVDFSRYRLHDEVGEVLAAWHDLFPNLTRLHTIGSSYWGKDLWVLEVTNFETTLIMC